MRCFALLLLALASLATGRQLLRIEYQLPGLDAWQLYAEAEYDGLDMATTMNREFAQGKVVSSIAGDSLSLAHTIWDAYKPVKDAPNRIIFRLTDQSTELQSLSSFSLKPVKNQKRLAKLLSHLDFAVQHESKGAFISATVRAPIDELEHLETIRNKIGTVSVVKPLKETRVVEALPRAVSVEELEEKEQGAGKPVPQQQSFIGKYWWLIMGGMLLAQLFKQPVPEEAPAQQGEQQQPQQQPQPASGAAGGRANVAQRKKRGGN